MTNYLKDPKTQRNLLLIAVVVLIFCLRSCGPSKGELNTMNQNLFALNDTLRSYKTKTGQLIYEKGALIADKSSLEKYNKALSDEIKNLKDHPVVVIKPEIRIVEVPKYIPVYIKDSTKNEDGSITRSLEWAYDTTYSEGNFRKLKGDFRATVDSNLNLSTTPMHINRDEFGMSLTTGLTENKKGLLEIFVTSKYPGFSVTNLDGALIDPAKSKVLKKYFPPKRWAVGVFAGYGICYDPTNLQISRGIQLGVGIQYNLFQWNFKK